MGAALTIIEAGGLETDFPPSRARAGFTGEKPGAVLLAWLAPCSAHHRAAEEQRVVNRISSSEFLPATADNSCSLASLQLRAARLISAGSRDGVREKPAYPDV